MLFLSDFFDIMTFAGCTDTFQDHIQYILWDSNKIQEKKIIHDLITHQLDPKVIIQSSWLLMFY